MSYYNLKLDDSGNVSFDLFEMIGGLPEDKLNEIAEFLSWDMIIEHLDKHLRGESAYSSWDTSGNRGGARIREHIEKVQGTKDERIKDLESKVRSFEQDAKHYKKYCDWYFKSYHHDHDSHQSLERRIGKPGELNE